MDATTTTEEVVDTIRNICSSNEFKLTELRPYASASTIVDYKKISDKLINLGRIRIELSNGSIEKKLDI